MQKVDLQPLLSIDNKDIEEIKKLRTNIIFLKAKVFNITSVIGKEGKSMISFWIAKSLSETDKKVVLIDADIRKNDMNSIFKIDNMSRKGLSDYLIYNVPLEDIICNSNYNNLDFILSGRSVKRPTELLCNSKFKNLINFCRDNYEYVIIDTPAAGEVTDSAIIAAYADGSILVIEPGMADYELAKKVKEQLERSGSRLLGVVLNKV